MRQNGGYIGYTPSLSGASASGVWTLDEVARYRQAGTWPTVFPRPPVSGAALWLDPNVVGTALDASNNTITVDSTAVATWKDSSGNGRDATQTTSSNRPTWRSAANGRNGYAVLQFNGNGQRIDCSSDAAWGFGTGDFTIESWINLSSINNNYQQVFPTVEVSGGFSLYYTGPGNYFGVGASSFVVSNNQSNYQATPYTWPTNTWIHIAVCRASGSLRIFVNGTQINTTLTSTPNYAQGVMRIGGDSYSASHSINGKLQNLLIYNGQALYTSNFTPWLS